MTSTGPRDVPRDAPRDAPVHTPVDVQRGGEPVGVKAPPDRTRTDRPGGAAREPAGPAADPPPERPDQASALPLALRVATKAVAALLVSVSLVHVLFVFLQVAPANPISQRYARQIQSWVYPLFEQNWRLFAPDPQSSLMQISARTVRNSAHGSQQVSGWFDLTAVDDAAVRHDPFPSHSAQNMLRRAWTGYLESHGNGDGDYSDRAVMWGHYLRNIAVDRVTAARPGAITGIQLRVRTQPIAGDDATGRKQQVPPSAVNTRYLPWWKASTHEN